MGVLHFYSVARVYRLVRHSIPRTHEVTLEFFVQHLDFCQPLARGCADPSRHQRTRRKSMMLSQRRSIHVQGYQRVAIRGFLDRNASDKRRHLPRYLVQPAEHHMLTCRPHFGALQHIAQAWPAETCGPNRALFPLHSWHMRNGECPAVPGAFQSVDDGVLFHFRQLRKSEGQRLLHFPTYAEPPLSGVHRAGLVHVIADKEVLYRRYKRVRVFDRHFQIEKPERPHNHSVLARNRGTLVCPPAKQWANRSDNPYGGRSSQDKLA